MRKYRYWLKSRTQDAFGAPLSPMYVYTFENPNGQTHVNWVVHVPPVLFDEFSVKVQDWAEKTHTTLGDYDIYQKAVNPTTAKTLAKYIIKGVDPIYIEYMHLKNFACSQGQVWGRRATASPALSRAARKEAGYSPKRDRGKLLVSNDDNLKENAA
jgi:hypothetical protein